MELVKSNFLRLYWVYCVIGFFIVITPYPPYEADKFTWINPRVFSRGDDLPVESVSWYDVQEFILKLNEKEGTDKYRLPSEAKWEYACRAGTTTLYSFGDSESELAEYAWYYDDKTHPVGQKKQTPASLI